MKSNKLFYIATLAALSLNACGGDGKDESDKPCDGLCTETQKCNEETNLCEDIKDPHEGEKACVTDLDCDGTDCVDGYCKVECQTTSDCANGKVCEKNKCVDDVECKISSECTGGLICKDNACVPECTTKDDCSGDLVCKSNKCVPECEADDDCEGDLVCKRNVCQNECEVDADCDGSLVCEGKRCVYECEQNIDCGDEGKVCRDHECRPLCETDDHCDGGYCQESACVECKTDDHCEGGLKCASNHCVECTSDTECEGASVCEKNVCVFECTEEDNRCGEDKPFCVDNHCSECEADNDQCEGLLVCRDHACVPECTNDIECEGKERCSEKQVCVQCIESADCGENEFCYSNVCGTCGDNDYDCDGVENGDDVCPYNSKYTNEEGVDCNYVTDEDGTKVFEIYHARDFIRLNAELHVLPEPPKPPAACHETEAGATPAPGDCCDDSYEATCSDDKALACVLGYVTETTCTYGCGATACNACAEKADDADYAVGNCCDMTTFAQVCSKDKVLFCAGNIVKDRACEFGCSEDGSSCLACTTPEADASPVEGNCCDASTFVTQCSEDGKKQLTCVDGVVRSNACQTACVKADDSGVLYCMKAHETPSFKVRLMKDINLLKYVDGDAVKDVEFNVLSHVNWFEKTSEDVTDPETGETTKVEKTIEHNPSDLAYTPFVIGDDTCVVRWDSISLIGVDLDGNGRRLYAETDDGKACSLVDPLFGDVVGSNIHDMNLNYNVRGGISAMLASSVARSSVTDINVKGNINLEEGAAIDEVNASSFAIVSNSIKDTDNVYANIRYKGNITTSDSVKNGKVFSGFIGKLANSVVENISLEVPDFFFIGSSSTKTPNMALISQEVSNSQLTKVESSLHFVSSGQADTVLSFVHKMVNSRIADELTVTYGDVRTPSMRINALGQDWDGNVFENGINAVLGDVEAASFDIWSSVSDFVKGNVNVEVGNVVASDTFAALARNLVWKGAPKAIAYTYGDIKTHDLYPYSYYIDASGTDGVVGKGITGKFGKLDFDGSTFGIANMINAGVALEDMSLTFGDINFASSSFSIIHSWHGSVIKNVTIKAGNVTGALNGNFYGFLPNGNDMTLDNVSVEYGDVTVQGDFSGFASNIMESTLNNISLKYGHVKQQAYHTTTATLRLDMFNGFAGMISKGKLNHVDLNIASIETPYSTNCFISGSDESTIEDVKLVIGDVTGTDATIYASFYGLCSECNDSMSRVYADFGKIVRPRGPAYLVGNRVNPDVSFDNLRIHADALISWDYGNVGIIRIMSGKMTNSAFDIGSMVGGASTSAIGTLLSGAKLENIAFYADMYSQEFAAGFIQELYSCDVMLKNIFSASKVNSYKSFNDETLTPQMVTANVVTRGLLFDVLSDACVATTTVAEGSFKTVKFDYSSHDSKTKNMTNPKNLYWLKRVDAQKAVRGSEYKVSLEDDQFTGFYPGAEQYALATYGETMINSDDTLSGCTDITAADCESVWAPKLKSITEKDGSVISIPWLKDLADL